jgi:hypothetical protein
LYDALVQARTLDDAFQPLIKVETTHQAMVRDVYVYFGRKREYADSASLLPPQPAERVGMAQFGTISVAVPEDFRGNNPGRKAAEKGVRVRIDVDVDMDVFVGTREGDGEHHRRVVGATYVTPWFEPSELIVKSWMGKEGRPRWQWQLADVDRWLEMREWSQTD